MATAPSSLLTCAVQVITVIAVYLYPCEEFVALPISQAAVLPSHDISEYSSLAAKATDKKN